MLSRINGSRLLPPRKRRPLRLRFLPSRIRRRAVLRPEGPAESARAPRVAGSRQKAWLPKISGRLPWTCRSVERTQKITAVAPEPERSGKENPGKWRAPRGRVAAVVGRPSRAAGVLLMVGPGAKPARGEGFDLVRARGGGRGALAAYSPPSVASMNAERPPVGILRSSPEFVSPFKT